MPLPCKHARTHHTDYDDASSPTAGGAKPSTPEAEAAAGAVLGAGGAATAAAGVKDGAVAV